MEYEKSEILSDTDIKKIIIEFCNVLILHVKPILSGSLFTMAWNALGLQVDKAASTCE
jgi:hypothetical protein